MSTNEIVGRLFDGVLDEAFGMGRTDLHEVQVVQ
jgi:hypothetical protein